MKKTYTATKVEITVNRQVLGVSATGVVHDEFPIFLDYSGNLVREKPKPQLPEREAKWRFEV